MWEEKKNRQKEVEVCQLSSKRICSTAALAFNLADFWSKREKKNKNNWHLDTVQLTDFI